MPVHLHILEHGRDGQQRFYNATAQTATRQDIAKALKGVSMFIKPMLLQNLGVPVVIVDDKGDPRFEISVSKLEF